jgi:hypothetical protein
VERHPSVLLFEKLIFERLGQVPQATLLGPCSGYFTRPSMGSMPDRRIG